MLGRAATMTRSLFWKPVVRAVQVRKAGSYPADLAAMGVQIVEPVVGLVEEVLELAEAGRDPPVADLEELTFGAVDRLLDLRRVLIADAGDLAGRSDQVPKDRLALDDPGVLDGMDRGRRLGGQARQERPTTDRLQVAGPLEDLRDGDDVDRFAALEQVEDGAVDEAVGLPVEILWAEELRDLDDRVAVDQDRAEHGLLGLQALGRKAVDQRVPMLGCGCDTLTVTPRTLPREGLYRRSLSTKLP